MTRSPPASPVRAPSLERSRLAQRLRRVVRGEVLFDSASRGRYATDASDRRVEPLGVVVPRDDADVLSTLALARELEVPVRSRGAGVGSDGAALSDGLVIDTSRHLDRILGFDAATGVVAVQPGLVLERLNAALAAQGFWLPVDVDDADRATLGGIVANDASGPRALGHGGVAGHLIGVDAVLSDGTQEHFGAFGTNTVRPRLSARAGAIVSQLFQIAGRERDEIQRAWPRVHGPVGGYNLDAFAPVAGRAWTDDGSVNLGHLFVGSRGCLAHFDRLHFRLARVPAHRVVGAWRLASARGLAERLRELAAQGATAIEWLDRRMLIALRDVPEARPWLGTLLDGDPHAVLLVEFAGDSRELPLRGLRAMRALADDTDRPGAVIPVEAPAAAAALWALRGAAVRRLPSPRTLPGAGLADGFVLPLARLDDWLAHLAEFGLRQGTEVGWYGSARAGAMRLRLAIDPDAGDRARWRALVDEAGRLAAAFSGVHQGGNPGAARAGVFGARIDRSFAEVERLFDPNGVFAPTRRDATPGPAATLVGTRFEARIPVRTGLHWPDGLAGAVGACDGNGACRALDAGIMCPSYRVTRAERDSTRGRAATLRLALEGRFGPRGLAGPEVAEALSLCVGCKACRSECPAGVDMARMKIEAAHQRRASTPLRWRERMAARLPDWAPWAARLPWLFNLREHLPGLPWLFERLAGIPRRPLPRWRRDTFLRSQARSAPALPDATDVLLFADCFDDHFEPENLHAAMRVLASDGRRVAVARPAADDPRPSRPLCCGRPLLAAGLVDEARAEAARTVAALAPFVARGIPVVGLEPECLLTMRDEFLALGLGDDARGLADAALLLEEYLAREQASGRASLRLGPVRWPAALLQAHCHQQAFGAVPPARELLARIPGLRVDEVPPGCCGMAGGFGDDPATQAVSTRMASLALVPAVRAAAPDAVLIADGFGCRRQIADTTGRDALHLVRVLDASLASAADRLVES